MGWDILVLILVLVLVLAIDREKEGGIHSVTLFCAIPHSFVRSSRLVNEKIWSSFIII